MTTTVAVAQFVTGLDKQENLKLVTRGIAAGADRGARLVVTPEYSMYNDPKRVGEDSAFPEPLDGPWLTAVREAARAAEVHVVVGMTEHVPGETRAANTVVAVGADGEILGAYRKVHLYDAFGFRESDTLIPGEITEPVTFELDGFRFGIMTCYDLRFPESARTLVDAGANALIVPAAWVAGPGKERHWATLLAARAIENTAYVLGAAQTGPRFAGHSEIIDPMGFPLASAGEAPGTITTQLDPARLDDVRAKNPALQLRRFRVVPT